MIMNETVTKLSFLILLLTDIGVKVIVASKYELEM